MKETNKYIYTYVCIKKTKISLLFPSRRPTTIFFIYKLYTNLEKKFFSVKKTIVLLKTIV